MEPIRSMWGVRVVIGLATVAIAAHASMLLYRLASTEAAQKRVQEFGRMVLAPVLPAGRAQSGSGPWGYRKEPGATHERLQWHAFHQTPWPVPDGSVRCVVADPTVPMQWAVIAGHLVAVGLVAMLAARGRESERPSPWLVGAATSPAALLWLVAGPAVGRLSWNLWFGVGAERFAAQAANPEAATSGRVSLGAMGIGGIFVGVAVVHLTLLTFGAIRREAASPGWSTRRHVVLVAGGVLGAALLAFPQTLAWFNRLLPEDVAQQWIPY